MNQQIKNRHQAKAKASNITQSKELHFREATVNKNYTYIIKS